MQVTVNESFVGKRTQLGKWSSILGFIVLISGMIFSLQPLSYQWASLVPWFTLGVGLFLVQIGRHYSSRYGLNPRVDRALHQGLKALDNRNHLYSFIKEIPTDHLLVTPNGAFVLQTEPFIGDITNVGRRWSRPWGLSGILQRLTDAGMGNPTVDAERDTQAIQKYFRAQLGETIGATIPVQPIIVFTNPRVTLHLSDSEVPVVQLPDLRNALRRFGESSKLPPEVQRALARGLPAENLPSARKAAPTTSSRSSTWQRTQKTTPK